MVIACQPWLNQPASRNLMSDDNDNWFRFTPLIHVQLMRKWKSKRDIDYHFEKSMRGKNFHPTIIHLINLCIAQKIMKKSNLTNSVKK